MKKAIGWIFLRLIAVAACVALAVFIYPMHLQSVVEGMKDAPEITVSSDLPLELVSGPWPYGHCQGIAVDKANGWVYYSFTTALVKTDFEGNMLGSVIGLYGHLGCIEFNEADGKVYGSLEYKFDEIGQGVMETTGQEIQTEAFYIAIFDGAAIDRVDMDASADGVMKTVYMAEVYEDYSAIVENEGVEVQHRYGCGGIDGVSFGPIPGSSDDAQYLFMSYGIYEDNTRTDNDHMILLCYDISDWDQYAQPLDQGSMHTSGPGEPLHKYFVLTGNTKYGVQNLEYDAYNDAYIMAVYRGSKEGFPNNPLYIVDASIPAYIDEEGREMLTLVQDGEPHYSGVYSWNFNQGAYGIHAFGDGTYYIAQRETSDSGESARIWLFKWDGKKVPMRRAG